MIRLTRDHCYEYLQTKVFTPLSQQAKNPLPPCGPGWVGQETEMLAITVSTNSVPQIAPLYGETHSVLAGLTSLCNELGWQPTYAPAYYEMGQKSTDQLTHSIQLPDRENLTFEPGGQLEYATRPHENIPSLMARVREVQAQLDAAMAKESIQLHQVGRDPWHSIDEVPLQMPFGRYQAMTHYFTELGPWGPEMMRQTCSLQVSLDYSEDEERFLNRYLAAYLLVPFATAIFANSPVVAGNLTEWSSNRAHLWQHLDPSRAGLILPLVRCLAKATHTQRCLQSYLDFALAAPVMYIEALDYRVPQPALSFADWLEQPYTDADQSIAPTLDDFIIHLSLLFPEVRPRGFMEIRSVDALSRALQFVPLIFYVGLLYDDDSLNQVVTRLKPFIEKLPALLSQSVYGLKDTTLNTIAQELMQWAMAGISRLPARYHNVEAERSLENFHQHYTAKQRCPADDLRETWNRNTGVHDLTILHQVEEKQRELIG